MKTKTTWMLMALGVSFNGEGADWVKAIQVIDVVSESYSAYEIRKQVGDAILHAHPIKQELVSHWRKHNQFTGIDLEHISAPYQVTTSSGTITINLVEVADVFKKGEHIQLIPNGSSGFFEWDCQSNVTSNRVPMSCRAD